MRVVALYALFSVVWILLSDRLLGLIAPDDRSLTLYQHFKGTAFVLVSALVLYFLLQSEHRFRETAQQALREREERFRNAIHQAPFPAMIHADDDRVVHVNRAWLDATGYTPADIPTVEAWLGLAYGESGDALRERVARLYDLENPSVEGDYTFRTRDGRLRTWHLCSAPLGRDAQGRRLVISMAADVTERLQTVEALRLAMDREKDAARAKDQFLAALSHELRTPLTPVLASVSASLAAGDDSTPGPADYLEQMRMIHRNIELEARLIDDLLDVTRVVRGKVQLSMRPIDLVCLLAEVLENCRGDFELRHVRLLEEIPADPLMVMGEAARLQQVFSNILRNAAKFSPAQSTTRLQVATDGAQVRIRVSDQGVGMDSTELRNLFQPFVQARPASGGLGLGLSIARAMAELHGGAISAASEGRDRGCTFEVSLPLLKDAATAPSVPTAQTAAPTNHRPLRILLVEDHPDTSRIMQRLLERQGHVVTAAGDVPGALAAFRSGAFDLLLSDIGLPGKSGLDLIRELRQSGSQIPAIAISGFGREEDIRASSEAGFAEHLTKPLDIARLQNAIARNIEPAASVAPPPPL
jgi:two-component system CheB/CheR fusion protein